MADEELVDQKKYLEDSCRPKCVKPLLEYEEGYILLVVCGHVLRELKEMTVATNIVQGSTLTIGSVLINALHRSYSLN
ncbi:PREDICTED: uncharacterized protein LOC105138462 isoform X2 [Populus euphratica]|uniref:Uncharacterized protein LOC105138462 isoform X2 n=1 Tax=Populus euphratica TaxID=75702 RepID=A0AAJ6V6Q6_POPEU|nr:PREDICTED: uncharacterized protein LOC105138462 isoform X2 [Populus euphratica]